MGFTATCLHVDQRPSYLLINYLVCAVEMACYTTDCQDDRYNVHLNRHNAMSTTHTSTSFIDKTGLKND